MTRRPIDFARLADALLDRVDSLLAEWLPHGVERAGRWYIGDFDGSPGESANVNLATGQWIDNGNPDVDKGGDLVSLYARIRGLTNGEAARELMERLGWERPDEGRPPSQAPAKRSDWTEAVTAAAADGRAAQDQAAPAPATDPAQAPAPRRGREPKYRAVVPVPAFAPKPGFRFGYKDKSKPGAPWVELDAVRTWEYRFGDTLYGYVARFERVSSEGELVKDTVARTWCEKLDDGSGELKWHWKQWEQPRPLYVPATLLSEGQALPVVIVEGEKCAEAGHVLLGHEFDFVSWPGGAAAWSMADWSWLNGRTVYLWPDCDAQRERLTKEAEASGKTKLDMPIRPADKQPGMKAMVGIGTKLLADHECTVHMCVLPKPGSVGDGWDIADAIASGWDAARVRDFVRAAVSFKSPNDEARAKAEKIDPSAAADEGGEAGGWRGKLLLSSSGATKACRENAVLALDGMQLMDGRWLPGTPEALGVIAFDEFSNNVIKLKPTPWGTPAGLWQEEDELEMGLWLTRVHYLPPMPRGTLEEAVLMVAKRHKVHPIRQHIEGLRGGWDGVKRMGTWLRRVCMEDDEIDEALQGYLARAGAWFLMGMVARVLTEVRRNGDVYRGPGTKFDYMLIFEGPQGWGKSTIAKVLGGQHYADTGLQLGEKDSYQNIQGIHVYEWGELDSMSKADVKLVKLFIASDKDRFRATFDRRPRDYPRQVVFVGTTNEDHYLSDATGNRRFWPVRLTRPADLAWLREHRDQLLAEALHFLDLDVRFHPTVKEQRDLFDPQQQLRMVENSIETLIHAFLFDEKQHVSQLNGVNGTLVDEVGLTDLLSRIGYSSEKQTAAVMKQAASVMSRLGWPLKKMGKDEDGHRPYKYQRPKGTTSGSAGRGTKRPTQGSNSTETGDDSPF